MEGVGHKNLQPPLGDRCMHGLLYFILLPPILLFVVSLIDSVLRDILNSISLSSTACMLRIQMLSSFFALLLADLARPAVIY
jgi:hypothetical protein